jgi:hypothetical protein
MSQRALLVYGLRAVPKPHPARGKSQAKTYDQKEESLAAAQLSVIHVQIRFTIRPGTTMIFWIFLVSIQAERLVWARITFSISPRVAVGEI